jgi:hypothetical protein
MATVPESERPPSDGTAAPPAPEPPYVYIARALQSGTVIPFLGAGASLASRREGDTWTPASDFLPKTAELAAYLDQVSGYPPSPDDLSRVAQYFDVVTGRAGLDETLREIFSKSYAPTAVHHHLAQFTNILIVTTNYDTLLEQAFGSKPHHLVVYNASAPNLLLWEHGADTPKTLTGQNDFPPLGDVPVIFKMHGAPDRRHSERDSYVITEEDYLEFLTRMQSHQAVPLTYAEHFRRSHFLFLGYGLGDWNLRVILHKIWKDRVRPATAGISNPTKPRASWAIQHRVRELEQQFWSLRGLSIYEMSIEQFVQKLAESR